MTTLYLIRHGETEWNVLGRYQGQLDPPLNARGRAQARATAAQLAPLGFDAIYSSDLARARETAQPLVEQAGLPLQLDARLREIHQGEWQGILSEQIRAQWPEALAYWQQQPWACSPPGGERLAQVRARLLEAVADMTARYPRGTMAVFTHKLPVALLKIYYQNHAPSAVWSLLPTNGAWEVIEVGERRERVSQQAQDDE
ncbi:MAG: histidine phosphatase family protein [Ardenticatenales bacterium]|nr:histidine phosphatase family protein [Ardenticatenales bacterium]